MEQNSMSSESVITVTRIVGKSQEGGEVSVVRSRLELIEGFPRTRLACQAGRQQSASAERVSFSNRLDASQP